MANRNWNRIQALGKERKVLSGSFSPNGSSAPTGVKGIGFSVARTGVGQFTITLQDSYPDYDCLITDLSLGTPAGEFTQIGAVDVKSAKTVVIETYLTGTGLADIAAGANNRIFFMFILKNTSLAQ